MYTIYSYKCTCTCKCQSPCTERTICLCLCNEATKELNKICICFCKKQDTCKCVCICICKSGQTFCCETPNHQCKDCLIKIDIGTLEDKSFKILFNLRSIMCYLSRLEKKNCPCYCCKCGCSRSSWCFLYCCCKAKQINYESIISKISEILPIFKEIGTKIPELIKLKNILSLVLVISSKCAKCGDECTKQLPTLITNIDKASRYYYLFGSRIEDIEFFVKYKFLYSNSKEIICNLGKSSQCLLITIKKMMKDMVNPNYTTMFNRVLLSIFSHYSIFQCYVGIFSFSQCSPKIYKILYTIGWADGCYCLQKIKSIIKSSSIDIYNWKKYFSDLSNKNINDLKKSFINVDKHLCLCIVIKCVLYPSLIKGIYCFRQLYLEASSTQMREFLPNVFNSTEIDFSKVIYLVITFLDKIMVWMKNNIIGYKVCFCIDINNPYYPYLVSIILYLSSLIENILIGDINMIHVFVNYLSTIMRDFDIITNNKNKKEMVSCNKVSSLIVNKQCQKDAKKSCCWCVAIVNLLVGCVSMCVQCRIKKVIKTGEVKISDYCNIEEYKCSCPPPGNGCCLLKLALSSQFCNSEELEDWLKKCCESCAGGGTSCKTILTKVKEGQADLLVIGCNCNCENKADQVKTWCALFKNLCGRSVAVVIVCKCQDPQKCCCLTNAIEKIKGELAKLCEECKCQQLTGILDQICKDPCCEGGECPCKELKEKLKKICGTGGDCLCKKIDALKTFCEGRQCPCKAEACCRCVCSKVMFWSVGILRRACRQNFLEPFKRIVIDLISSSTNKAELRRKILDSINNSRQKQTFLVKNTYSTHSNTYSDHKNISNRFPSLTMGYAYDTVYEHQISGGSYPIIKGFARGDPSTRNPDKIIIK